MRKKFHTLIEYIEACKHGEFTGKNIYLVAESIYKENGQTHVVWQLSGSDSVNYEMKVTQSYEESLKDFLNYTGITKVHWT